MKENIVPMSEAYGSSFADVLKTAQSSHYFHEVTDFLSILAKHGFSPEYVDDTEYLIATPSFAEAAIAITAVDDAKIALTHDDGDKVAIWIVLGNSRGELPCDYSVNEKLDAAIGEYYEKWGD